MNAASTIPRSVTSVLIARKVMRCDGRGCRIARGDRYLAHVMPPSRRLGNTTDITTVECMRCAGQLGRQPEQQPEAYAVPLFDPEGIA
ncbi:MAG: hypothetical protein J0I40_10805 [Cellulomonas sp.]|uniref:hypothetical protein n=1 Tax=Cellulomonas sp. 73-92 TaxID=1895740 RepID=UPI000928A812|nr:hypothetical protein [Cellulomonas sp. 73-92]MBN9375860.1 hypothetical protein [Cellulomonas sp.]OJV76538.1 MAG: hypothetical protein BGO37_10840 [Cellulomonas sp. 73-92]